MDRLKAALHLSFPVAAILVSLQLAACGSGEKSGAQVLQPDQVEAVLNGLPYRVSLREPLHGGDDEIVYRGSAQTVDDQTVLFAISLGDQPRPAPIPRVGTKFAVGLLSRGFIFNSNAEADIAGDTIKRLRNRIDLLVDMEQALCLAANSEPCPL